MYNKDMTSKKPFTGEMKMTNIKIQKIARAIWYGDIPQKPEGVSAGRWRAAIESAKGWISERSD